MKTFKQHLLESNLLSELYIRKHQTPDEIVDSFFLEIQDVALKRRLEFDYKVMPIPRNDLRLENEDEVIVSVNQNPLDIFEKPNQVFIGEFHLEPDGLNKMLRVKEILYSAFDQKRGDRTIEVDDERPLICNGQTIKGVIHHERVILIWHREISERIMNYYYQRELDARAKENSGVMAALMGQGDVLDATSVRPTPDQLRQMKIKSKRNYIVCVKKKFPKKYTIDDVGLKENYVIDLSKRMNARRRIH